jgi:hypothetical protein
MTGGANSMVHQTETLSFGRSLSTYQQNHPGLSSILEMEPEVSLILLVITGNHLQN